MGEKMLKTHLIITDIRDEYRINWCGKLIDVQPVLKNGMPIFILISSTSRVEMNTINMKQIEDCAKKITYPRGREAITTDKTYIYIQEVSGKNHLMGVVTHNRIKSYAPMYDKFEYR